MANYAVINNGTVVNTIVADSQEIAEQLTGLSCIEYTSENPLGINWYFNETANKYVSPSPYASWVYNVADDVWEAPIPMPVEEGKYFVWNEQTVSWDSFNLPEEE